MTQPITLSTIIGSTKEQVFDAFVQPEMLRQFWLSEAEAPLEINKPVRWAFMVPGAEATATATRMDRPAALSWTWPGDMSVDLAVSDFDADHVLAELTVHGLPEGDLAAAANTAEGFTLVLNDLKLLLETGRSPGLVAAKARRIAHS